MTSFICCLFSYCNASSMRVTIPSVLFITVPSFLHSVWRVSQIKSFQTLATQSWHPFSCLHRALCVTAFIIFYCNFLWKCLFYIAWSFISIKDFFCSFLCPGPWYTVDTQILIEKVKAFHNRISDHLNLFLNFLDHFRIFHLLLFSHFSFCSWKSLTPSKRGHMLVRRIQNFERESRQESLLCHFLVWGYFLNSSEPGSSFVER